MSYLWALTALRSAIWREPRALERRLLGAVRVVSLVRTGTSSLRRFVRVCGGKRRGSGCCVCINRLWWNERARYAAVHEDDKRND